MRFVMPPMQLRLGGWRLGARSARFLLFGVIGGLCGVLWDPLVCLGVLDGSMVNFQDYLVCPWSFGRVVEAPWGVPEKSGTPQGSLELIEKQMYCVCTFIYIYIHISKSSLFRMLFQ